MAKTRVNRRERLEVKKKIRDAQICPHCSKRFLDLEDHIKRCHGFFCNLCGKTFAQRQQWVSHMQHLHSQTELAAERDSKVSQIDAWLRKQAKSGKGSRTGRTRGTARLPAGTRADAQCAGAGLAAASAEMEADSDDGMPAGSPLCTECGVEGPAEAALLARQCLAFRCELVGRRCITPGSGLRAVVPPAPGPEVPPPPMQPGFGQGLPPISFAPVPASALAGFAQELAQAANVPIGDDDDDDL